jgi:DNA ligase-1
MSLDATKTEAKSFQPLLAERKSPDIAKLKYPVIASPKLDGVRCVTTNDGGRSRTLKPFPNMALDEALYGLPAWLDGELIYGEPNTEGVFNRTQSAVSTIEGTTEGLTYYVFDNADPADRHLPFISRLTLVRRKLSNLQGSFSIPIRLLEQRSINTAEELARALQADNDRFDSARFLTACGVN